MTVIRLNILLSYKPEIVSTSSCLAFKKLIGQSALNEYRVAQFIAECRGIGSDTKTRPRARRATSGYSRTSYIALSIGKIRIRAECCFGNGGNEKSVRRIIEPTAAIFVMNNITDKQKLKALLEHSARIARETAMPISRGEMMRLAEQLVGYKARKRPCRECARKQEVINEMHSRNEKLTAEVQRLLNESAQ